jgi:hypothetical protein
MRLSATQFETAELCYKKWYALKVLKLPTPAAKHFTYGTVLHEVVERFLSATPTGEVPPGDHETGPLAGQVPGEPVKMYPMYWARDISLAEARHIRSTVEKAIEDGVIYRRADGKVERGFTLPFVDKISVTGKIDYSFSNEIHDHKTTKDFKWAKTPKTIVKSTQMLLYGWAHNELSEAAHDEIVLRHNVFHKKVVEVRAVENTVTKKEIEEKVDSLRELATTLKELKEEKTWEELEGPNVANGCTAFGGCPFQDICSGLITVDQYRSRIAKIQEASESRKLPAPFWAFANCKNCRGSGWRLEEACDICIDAKGIKLSDIEIHKKEDSVLWVYAGQEGKCAMPDMQTPTDYQRPSPEGLHAQKLREDKMQFILDDVPPNNDFVLAINCTPVKGREMKDLQEVFNKVAEELAKELDKESYYLLHAFDRRDMVASKAKEITKNMSGVYIVRPDTPDMRSFVESIRPFAKEIWEPVAGTVTVVS